jgi:hypothetical protein
VTVASGVLVGCGTGVTVGREVATAIGLGAWVGCGTGVTVGREVATAIGPGAWVGSKTAVGVGSSSDEQAPTIASRDIAAIAMMAANFDGRDGLLN